MRPALSLVVQAKIIGGFPDPPVIMGHVGVTIAKGAERILYRVGKAWHAPNMRAFANTLCPDGVVR